MNMSMRGSLRRRGAVAPLMAFLIPIVLLLCGISVNFAYMQLNRTELRVATDAAARAAGRAWSEFQSIDEAVDYAVSTAALNNVGSNPLVLDPEVDSEEILFGVSQRLENGYGRYDFDEKARSAVANKTAKANSVRIIGKRTSDSLGGTIRMLFAGFGPFDEFSPVVVGQCTQVDRDIALVLDKSGSMLEYKDFLDLEDEAQRLRNEGRITSSERNNALTSNIWARSYPYYSYSRYYGYYYDRFYYFHYDDSYNEDLWEYAYDYQRRKGSGSTPAYNTNDPAPRHSRWAQVEDAVAAFLDVLDNTDQEERVSMVTFNSDADVDVAIDSDFDDIRDEVDGIAPKNGTNIADGLDKGADSILDYNTYPKARFYAAKTIVVMSDGDQTVGSTLPRVQAQAIVNAANVTIHTITFSTSISNAGREEMQEVARIGGGRYYHADTGEELVEIFEEIANNLPTIITE